jgi:hypothetical protein
VTCPGVAWYCAGQRNKSGTRQAGRSCEQISIAASRRGSDLQPITPVVPRTLPKGRRSPASHCLSRHRELPRNDLVSISSPCGCRACLLKWNRQTSAPRPPSEQPDTQRRQEEWPPQTAITHGTCKQRSCSTMRRARSLGASDPKEATKVPSLGSLPTKASLESRAHGASGFCLPCRMTSSYFIDVTVP